MGDFVMSILVQEEARLSSTEDATSLSGLTEELKSRALALGFQKVGVVRAEALTEERARLEEWLARGHHAGMTWMASRSGSRRSGNTSRPGLRSCSSQSGAISRAEAVTMIRSNGAPAA